MDHPKPGLRYVDADDLDGSAFDFNDLDVQSRTGEKLGDVDGFILDVASARPRYVVVNAGGWFTSKFFLLPIGHATLDIPGKRLVADVSKEHVRRYPGFDRDEFEKLSTAELDRMDQQFAAASWIDQSTESPESPDFQRRYQEWRRNQDATWWDASYYRPDRLDAGGSTGSMGSMGAVTSSGSMTSEGWRNTRTDEQVTASGSRTVGGETSPHAGGRAQPGDVVGVETGGEQTHVGDTSEDENERRRAAERAAAKARRD